MLLFSKILSLIHIFSPAYLFFQSLSPISHKNWIWKNLKPYFTSIQPEAFRLWYVFVAVFVSVCVLQYVLLCTPLWTLVQPESYVNAVETPVSNELLIYVPMKRSGNACFLCNADYVPLRTNMYSYPFMYFNVYSYVLLFKLMCSLNLCKRSGNACFQCTPNLCAYETQRKRMFPV